MSVVLVLSAFVLIFSTPAHGGMVAKDQQGNAIYLKETPCDVASVLAKVHADHHSKFRRADMLYQGKKHQACWAMGPDGKVYVLDDVGDLTILPMQAFVPMLGV